MPEPLRVTLVQPDPVWHAPAANRARLETHFVALAQQTDLIVLPEMFTTGFTMEAAAYAESMDGPTLAWLREWADRTGAVLTGSLIVEAGGAYYNRLVWMPPGGDYRTYDKRHCFTLAGEHEHYTAGRERVVVEYRGWRILPLICYDLRFPVWSRNRGDYDLLLYVANWPAVRAPHWRSLLVARAIENQAYTVAVNRVGEDGQGHGYVGDSGIIDYGGKWRVRLHGDAALHTHTIELAEQQAFRARYAFLADRDGFTIH